MSHFADEHPDLIEPALRKRARRRAIVVIALTAILFTLLGYTVAQLAHRAQWEAERADQATRAAVANCEQVRELGFVCRSDPANLPQGERGDIGPMGPMGPVGPAGQSPTDAQIAAAVAAYLSANPPPAGPAGPAGENGGPGPSGRDGTDGVPGCPGHWAQAQMLVKPNSWQTVWVCFP